MDNESIQQSSSPPGAPRPEWLIRTVAALALVWGGAYLVWRIGWTWRGTNPALFVTLLVAELVGWFSLSMFTYLAWRRADCSPRPVTVQRSVDVLVPTYDEPVAVVRATLLGCAALRHPHTTWLLDDGSRPEMEELAASLGARYLTRPDNSHAKAGNINHALPHLGGELVAVLDADHVPLPEFLDTLAGHFDDPEVVLVQAPHEFYNLDSVQHMEGETHEQSLFFRVICAGKDRDNSVFWCGSGTMLRRSALEAIGGVQTATIAEDFHTSIVLHQRGGTTRYVDRTVLLGLAPHDLDSFLLQRSRWARGNLRVFRTAQNPLWATGLSFRQRLSYLGSLSHYFGGPQRLVLLVVLCITLLTGVLPLHGRPVLFAVLWAPWVVLSLAATKLLGRGYTGPLWATQFGWMTMGTYSAATVSLLLPGFGKFKVTPKGGSDPGGLGVLRRLPLLALGADALFACTAVRILAMQGWVDAGELSGFALLATLTIGIFELSIIVAVLLSLGEHRQQRVSYRFPVELTARVGDAVARVSDLNGRGAGLLMDHRPAVGGVLPVTLRIPGLDGSHHNAALRVRVRSVRPAGEGGHRVGVEFLAPGPEVARSIDEFCQVLLPARRAALQHQPVPRPEAPTAAPTSVASEAPTAVAPAVPAAAGEPAPASLRAG